MEVLGGGSGKSLPPPPLPHPTIVKKIDAATDNNNIVLDFNFIAFISFLDFTPRRPKIFLHFLALSMPKIVCLYNLFNLRGFMSYRFGLLPDRH
jgi:hypothetical protein